jgi:hypothetical protein
MKEVAHGIDEYHAGLLPTQRLGQLLRYQTRIEAAFIGVARNAAKSFRKNFCIAILTARTNLGAPSDRVPSRVCPLNR